MLPRLRLLVAFAALAVTASLEPSARAAVPPAQATASQRDEAQRRFVRGKALYAAGDYEAALAELRASHAVVASPNTHLYIARALREMGEVAEAYAELGRTVVEAKALAPDDPRYEKTAEAAAEERAALVPKLGLAELTREPANEQAAPASKPADAAPRAPVSPPPAEPEAEREGPTLRPFAYAATGVAAVSLATFIAFGAMANGTYGDLEQACGAGPCPAGHEDDVEAGRTQQRIANVGLAAFVVSGATAITMFLVGGPVKAAPVDQTAARITVGPGGVRGTF